ncbi:hypothetical protein [Leifsonia sp. 2MCAF36]|uniref:hypothetical protein n=1 Tax=Leifsonia sp. 2MCAF36 TaxID=3232988 RepID=UPI003F9C1073
MSIATRTAGPTGTAVDPTATGAVAVGDRAPRSGTRGTRGTRPSTPIVVIDLPRVAQRFRELRAALPWVDVRYDVCALAHPALLQAVAADGAAFVVSHDSGLPVLQRTGADLGRVLHATPGARWPRRRTAWEAGGRRFVVDDPHDLDGFAAAPAGTSLLLRLDPDVAVEAARRAQTLGVRVAGLALDLAPGAGSCEVLDAVQAAVETGARIASATGLRTETLDLGEVFGGPRTRRPEHVAELGRSIRSLVAPVTSRVTVTASAGRAVTADAITIVAGSTERYADAATASDYIDAGAEVLVLRRRRRILRPSRARSTWSPAG